jgi:hypothetical protein
MLRQIQHPEPAAPTPESKPRAPRKKKEVIEYIEPESNSDSGSDSSSYDDFAEVDEIKKHFNTEPCEFVSPAGLSKTKTKKEAIKYLEEKSCPKIHRLKKKAMSSPAAPTPSTAPAKKEKKVKMVEPASPLSPTQSPTIVLADPPQKKVKKVAKVEAPAPAGQGTPLAPSAAAPEKKKRAASAYALAVGRHRKTGLSFAEAVKAAKAELDSKKTN